MEHRIFKEPKYLLKTHTFPHSPHTFPQGFSTGVGKDGYTSEVDINNFDKIRPNPKFFDGRNIYHRPGSCANFYPLTRGECRQECAPGRQSSARGKPSGNGESLQKNYEKGIDFLKQVRYNVELYENNEKGDATNAQH